MSVSQATKSPALTALFAAISKQSTGKGSSESSEPRKRHATEADGRGNTNESHEYEESSGFSENWFEAKRPNASSSCHQCKSRRNYSSLTYCTSRVQRKTKRASCRKKYCDPCLRKFYKEFPPTDDDVIKWICPSCRNTCLCAACRRRRVMKRKTATGDETEEHVGNQQQQQHGEGQHQHHHDDIQSHHHHHQHNNNNEEDDESSHSYPSTPSTSINNETPKAPHVHGSKKVIITSLSSSSSSASNMNNTIIDNNKNLNLSNNMNLMNNKKIRSGGPFILKSPGSTAMEQHRTLLNGLAQSPSFSLTPKTNNNINHDMSVNEFSLNMDDNNNQNNQNNINNQNNNRNNIVKQSPKFNGNFPNVQSPAFAFTHSPSFSMLHSRNTIMNNNNQVLSSFSSSLLPERLVHSHNELRERSTANNNQSQSNSQNNSRRNSIGSNINNIIGPCDACISNAEIAANQFAISMLRNVKESINNINNNDDITDHEKVRQISMIMKTEMNRMFPNLGCSHHIIRNNNHRTHSFEQYNTHRRTTTESPVYLLPSPAKSPIPNTTHQLQTNMGGDEKPNVPILNKDDDQ